MFFSRLHGEILKLREECQRQVTQHSQELVQADLKMQSFQTSCEKIKKELTARIQDIERYVIMTLISIKGYMYVHVSISPHQVMIFDCKVFIHFCLIQSTHPLYCVLSHDINLITLPCCLLWQYLPCVRSFCSDIHVDLTMWTYM